MYVHIVLPGSDVQSGPDGRTVRPDSRARTVGA